MSARAARGGVIVVAAVVAACIVGPRIAGLLGLDGTSIDTRLGAAPPSWTHWLGTDALGRDLLVRVLVGGRIALTVATIATAVSLAIGLTYGAIAASSSGLVDAVMMRIVDALYGLPTTVLVVVVMAISRTRSLVVLIALISSVSWLTMARIVRGQVLVLRQREFALAARALGLSPVRILWRHLIPNAAGPVVTYATLALPQVMLTEAFLSFLGLGVQAPLASWGTLVSDGSANLVVYPWLLVAPTVVMGVTVVALNVVGDGLRDRLDPRSRAR